MRRCCGGAAVEVLLAEPELLAEVEVLPVVETTKIAFAVIVTHPLLRVALTGLH